LVTKTKLGITKYLNENNNIGTVILPVHKDKLSLQMDIRLMSVNYKLDMGNIYKQRDNWEYGNILMHKIHGKNIALCLVCCYISDKKADIYTKAFERAITNMAYTMNHKYAPVIISKRMIVKNYDRCINILDKMFNDVVISCDIYTVRSLNKCTYAQLKLEMKEEEELSGSYFDND
jgi:hypothetical protein